MDTWQKTIFFKFFWNLFLNVSWFYCSGRKIASETKEMTQIVEGFASNLGWSLRACIWPCNTSCCETCSFCRCRGESTSWKFTLWTTAWYLGEFFAFPRIEHIWKFSIRRVGWGKWAWIGRILVENIPIIYALILWLRSETFWLQKRERFLVFTQMLPQNKLVVWWVQNNALWVNKWCEFQTNLFFNWFRNRNNTYKHIFQSQKHKNKIQKILKKTFFLLCVQLLPFWGPFWSST